MLDTVIDMAVEGVAEIAEAAITRKIEKKIAEKNKTAAEENTENKTGNEESISGNAAKK